MLQKKTALITGCSQGGIGEALVRAFAAKGFHVFATLRNTSKAGKLAQMDGVEILQLDVSSTEPIKQAAKIVTERTDGALDVLVNNAGQDFVMPLLDASLDDVKRLYDINVWSILATTQSFAPLLIKPKGTLCNICSTAACMPFAYAGIYSSSNVAAQRISETLRIELQPLGVRVITGMIGSVQTPIHDNAGALVLPEGLYYGVVKETISKQRQGELKPGSEKPEVSARNIANDIIGGNIGLMWRGGMASVVRYLAYWAPGLLEHILTGDKTLGDVEKAHK